MVDVAPGERRKAALMRRRMRVVILEIIELAEALWDSNIPRFRTAHSSLSASLIKKEVRAFESSNWVPRGSLFRNKIIELVSNRGNHRAD